MPSRNRHRERAKGLQANTSWEDMLADKGACARLMGGTNNERVVAVVLNYLAGQMKPYAGSGWTVFNDWLDCAYNRHFNKSHDGIPFVTIDQIRITVFPECKVTGLLTR